MKKIVLILAFTFVSFNTLSAETYYCDSGALTGVTTSIKKPSFLKKIKLWVGNGVETDKISSGFRIVVDGDNSYIQSDGDPEKTKLILFVNTDEKAELLASGEVASAIYSIDKVHKKVMFARNTIVPTEWRYLLNAEPYQTILSGNCR